MKLTFTLFLLVFINAVSQGQINKKQLAGSWIKSKIEFIDGVQLPDEDGLKYQYNRYTFDKNKVAISTAFADKGTEFNYNIAGNKLDFYLNSGYKTNSYLIEKLTPTELVVLQKGERGFTQNDVLRYYFINENYYQNSWQYQPDDIISVSVTQDTVFKASDRLYPVFKHNLSLHAYIGEVVPELQNLSSGKKNFLASFVVRKDGTVDNIKVLERINSAFDSQVKKVIQQTSQQWTPAKLHGQPVDVQMTESFRFFTSEQVIPTYDYNQRGLDALRGQEYEEALYFFTKILEKIPNDTESLLHAAMCKIYLGNATAACQDLLKIKKTNNSIQVDELLLKYCQ